jgi:hypothetical protein
MDGLFTSLLPAELYQNFGKLWMELAVGGGGQRWTPRKHQAAAAKKQRTIFRYTSPPAPGVRGWRFAIITAGGKLPSWQGTFHFAGHDVDDDSSMTGGGGASPASTTTVADSAPSSVVYQSSQVRICYCTWMSRTNP